MNDMTETEHWYAYGDENGDGPWNDDCPFDGEIERWHTDEHGELYSTMIGYQLGICQN